MTTTPGVVIFGGSTEATALCRVLVEGHFSPTPAVTVSFAGRTSAPASPAGRIRVGGFGGVDGLCEYLRAERFSAAIDALHPFAARMPFNVAEAAQRCSLPLIKLVRPAWQSSAGDRWINVPDTDAAADASVSAQRVLLTVGRTDLDAFRRVAGPDFLVRSIEPADLNGRWRARGLLARGPFSVDDEMRLMAHESIDLLVSKNSGGTATAAKIEAARRLAIPVVMIERPALPSVETVTSVAGAGEWLRQCLNAT